jgi:hypothetical protein
VTSHPRRVGHRAVVRLGGAVAATAIIVVATMPNVCAADVSPVRRRVEQPAGAAAGQAAPAGPVSAPPRRGTGPTDVGPTDVGPTDVGPTDVGPTGAAATRSAVGGAAAIGAAAPTEQVWRVDQAGANDGANDPMAFGDAPVAPHGSLAPHESLQAQGSWSAPTPAVPTPAVAGPTSGPPTPAGPTPADPETAGSIAPPTRTPSSAPGPSPAPNVHRATEVVVTFRGDRTCGSHPDVAGVLAQPETWINVLNGTGHRSTMQVGARLVRFEAGAGRSMRLRPTRYVLQLRPDCLSQTGRVEPVLVDIRGDAPYPALISMNNGASRGHRTGWPPTQATLPGPAAGLGGAVTSGPIAPVPSSAGIGWTPSVIGGASSTGAAMTDGNQPDGALTELRPYVSAEQQARDRRLRRNRLIAIIALICAVGVTTALIRAIVTQRVTRPVGS